MPDRAAIHAALDVLLDTLDAYRQASLSTDALVPLTADGLKPYKVELRAAVRLADEGKLRTVQIGRRRYTTARHLAALVDTLEPARREAPVDTLLLAVERRARRRGCVVTRG